ncbi:MAG: hypothetical protein WC934_11165 [Acidithiobacillus sp.]|uniref:hypothetical protein n=1 Tax=Acidithiobacillus sp. TaxID=1872118 RepID=UPI00355E9EE0
MELGRNAMDLQAPAEKMKSLSVESWAGKCKDFKTPGRHPLRQGSNRPLIKKPGGFTPQV